MGAVRANVVGIVGAGRVGAACAVALVTRGSAAAVLLKDRTNVRAGAVASDLRDGALLLHPHMEVGAIHYAHLAAADVVILTVGSTSVAAPSTGVTLNGAPRCSTPTSLCTGRLSP